MDCAGDVGLGDVIAQFCATKFRNNDEPDAAIIEFFVAFHQFQQLVRIQLFSQRGRQLELLKSDPDSLRLVGR